MQWGLREVVVYDAVTGAEVSRPLAPRQGLVGLAALADGSLVTQELNAAEAVVWNPKTGQEVGRYKSRPVGVVSHNYPFAVHPSGRYLVVGPPSQYVGGKLEAKEATVVDTQSGAEVFRVPYQAPVSVCFTPDGKALRVAERYGGFRCFKYAFPSGKLESEKSLSVGSTGLALQVAGELDPASGRLAVLAVTSNPQSNRLCVFDTNTGGLVTSFSEPDVAAVNPETSVLSPGGRYLTVMVAGSQTEVIDLDTQTGGVRLRWAKPKPGYFLCGSPAGNAFAVSKAGEFELLRLGGAQVAVTPPNPNPNPNASPTPALPPDALDYVIPDRVTAAPPGQKVRLEWTTASKPGTPTLFAKAVAFTPDESLVVLARVNRKEIVAIDTRTGAFVAAYTGHATSPLGVVVLANGQAMSVEDGATEAVIWDPRTGKETGRVKCPTPPTRGRIGVFTASAEGRYIAAGARGNLAIVSGKGEKPGNPPGGGVDVIDTATGRVVFTCDHYSAEYAFTPDGKKLVVAEDRGRFVTYSVPDGVILSDRTVGTGQYATVSALHPGLARVVWIGRLAEEPRMTGYVVNTDTGKIEQPVKIDGGDPLAASLSPSGRHLLVAEQGYNPKQMTLRVTDLTSGQPLGSTGLFNQEDFQPINKVFVSPSGQAAVVRRLALGRVEFFTVGGEQVAVRPPEWTPTGKPPTSEEVAAVAAHYVLDPQPVPAVKGKAPLWATLTAPEEAKVNDFPVNGVAFTGDGRSLLLTRIGQTPIAVLDVRTGRVQTAFVGHTRPPLGVGILPDGRAISQEPDAGEAITWDPATGREFARIKSAKVSSEHNVPMQVSPNGKYLLFCKRGNGVLGSVKNENIPAPSGELVVVDLKTGTAARTLAHYDGQAAFSPDSRKVIYVDNRARIFTHDIEAGTVTEKVAVTEGEWGSVCSVTPAAGRAIWFGAVAVKGVNVQRVIDLASGKLLEEIPPGEESNNSGHRFLPDGRWLAYSGARGQTKETWFSLLDAKNNFAEAYRVPLKDLSSQTGEVALSPTGGHALVYRNNQNRLELVALSDPRVAIAPNPEPGPGPTTPDRREAVPADEKLANADADIRELFKADFAKKTPDAKKALAVKLLDLAAKTTDDPVTRYALLRTGQGLASEVGDVANALRATDAIASAYAVDHMTVKAILFEKFADRPLSPTAAKDLVEMVSVAADAAGEQDGFDMVVRLNQLLGTLARKGGFPIAVEDADSRLATAKRNRDMFKAVQPALEVLATKPTDPEANLAVGRFRCFVQARWEAGAAYLAKADHPQLKAAGTLEAKAPTDSAGLGQLADAWWEAASAPNVDPSEKKVMEAHARRLYVRALPGLTGLTLAKAESRTEFSIGGVTYAPGLVAEFSAKRDVLGNKKNRVDPTLDFDGGEFSARDGYSTDIAGRWTGVIVPPRPGRYKLVLVAGRYVENGRLLSRQAVLIDAGKGGRGVGEVVVTMGDKPFPITVEMPKCWNLQGYKFQLKWAPATGNIPESVIPAEYLFHDKKAVKK